MFHGFLPSEALSVVIPLELMAVSNMPTASETTLQRQRRITFLDTPKMSSYLLALAVGRFDSLQAETASGTLIRVLTMPQQAAQGTFALSVASRALSYYEETMSRAQSLHAYRSLHMTI